MDSFLHNHQAALDSQREAQAIRDVFGDEDDKYFFREVESKRFRKFKTIGQNKIPQEISI